MKILLVAILAALVLANGASFWFGSLHARQNIGVEKVSPAQLADAMQQDDFYSSYGNAALLFSAKVSKVVTKNNALLVTFTTGRPYDLTCQFPKSLPVTIGQSLSVAAPGGSAERQPHSVLLHNCVQN